MSQTYPFSVIRSGVEMDDFKARSHGREKCLLCSSCPSIFPHVSLRFPVDGFQWNFILTGLWKYVEKSLIWLKSGTVREDLFVCFWRDSPQLARVSSFPSFLDHTQRRTTVGRTPLDEWSARRRDLWHTWHTRHSQQTFMTPVGFEPTISAGERPQT